MRSAPARHVEPHPVRIGVVGPEDLVQATLQIGARFPALELVPFHYADEAQATALCQAAAPLVEVLLFTGPVPYYRVMSEGTPGVPSIYVRLTGAGLYRAFLLTRERFDIQHITIDTIQREIVREAYSELGLDDSGVRVLEYAGPVPRDDLVAFHESAYASGQFSGALTYLRSAYTELLRRQVPCYWVTPTPTEITAALEQALLLGQNARHKEMEIVVGVVGLDGLGKVARRAASEYAVQSLKLGIQSVLLQYVAEIDGYLIPGGGDEFLFFTTRGAFERYTRFLSSVPVVRRIRQEFDVSVSMGVGFGATAHQAGTHARRALAAARAAGGDACYVVLEDRRLLGPLGSAEQADVSLRHVSPTVESVARERGLTVAAAARFLQVAAQLKGEPFTVQELAPALGVTVRSAQRFLHALVASGCARPAGGERNALRGRPRQVYTLVLDAAGPQIQGSEGRACTSAHGNRETRRN